MEVGTGGYVFSVQIRRSPPLEKEYYMKWLANSRDEDGVEVPTKHLDSTNIEDRYRKAHNQLELFPVPRRRISWKLVAILIAASVLFLLFVSHMTFNIHT